MLWDVVAGTICECVRGPPAAVLIMRVRLQHRRQRQPLALRLQRQRWILIIALPSPANTPATPVSFLPRPCILPRPSLGLWRTGPGQAKQVHGTGSCIVLTNQPLHKTQSLGASQLYQLNFLGLMV